MSLYVRWREEGREKQQARRERGEERGERERERENTGFKCNRQEQQAQDGRRGGGGYDRRASQDSQVQGTCCVRAIEIRTMPAFVWRFIIIQAQSERKREREG